MRIVLAPDSFKESLSAVQAAEAMARGVRRALPDCEAVTAPIADGGEGTVEVLVSATGGQFLDQEVTGPLGEPVAARYGLLGDGRTAVIEMAAASGLPLVPEARRDPMVTTTRGTGELIRSALDRGVGRIVIGIGGSATVDGGAGMAQALGARLLDAEGRAIPPGGGGLARLRRVDLSALDPRVRRTAIEVASDVDNPLIGERGAARVYGPQKGATPETVAQLEANLTHLAEVVARDVGVRIADAPGAGAAGGLGGALMAFLGARLRLGFDIVAGILHLEKLLSGCDLVVTGEGRMDGQAVFGKAPVRLAQLAKTQGRTVVAIVGQLGEGWREVLDHGIDAAFSITDGPMPPAEAMTRAGPLIECAAEQVARLFAAGGPVRGGTPTGGGAARAP